MDHEKYNIKISHFADGNCWWFYTNDREFLCRYL